MNGWWNQRDVLNNRSPCLVWKPCLSGCLRRRAAFVDMSEQAVHLVLAEELKRQWVCKDGTGTSNGCQSTQRAQGSMSLKAWGHKLLGTGRTQAVSGSSPSGGHPARRVDVLTWKLDNLLLPGDPCTLSQRETAIQLVAEVRTIWRECADEGRNILYSPCSLKSWHTRSKWIQQHALSKSWCLIT